MTIEGMVPVRERLAATRVEAETVSFAVFQRAPGHELVGIPGLADVDAPALTVRRRGVDGWDARGPFTGLFEVNHPFEIRIDLSALVA